jgi:hypothetical protein
MKLYLYVAIIFLLASFSYASTIEREIPSSVMANQSFKVNIDIENISKYIGKNVTLQENIPIGLRLVNWSITGADQRVNNATANVNNGKIIWRFIPSRDYANISYLAVSEDMKILYIFGPAVLKNGSVTIANESIKHNLNVVKIVCGDGICEGSETNESCSKDCISTTTPSKTSTTTSLTTTTTKKEESYRQVPELKKPELPDIEVERTPPTLFIILVLALIIILSALFVYYTINKKRMKSL